MNLWKKIGNTLLLLIVIGSCTAIIYVNKAKIVPAYENLLTYTGLYEPCSKPIIYYIDQVDSRFGQSEEEFKNNLISATIIWNKALGKELFRYSKEEANKMSDLSKRKLSVNLIYDQRQQTTEQLKVIGSTIDSNKDSYENVKARYDRLKTEYNTKKQALEILISKYEADKASYEKEIKYWKNKGGAPEQQYAKIEIERTALNSTVQTINNSNQELNKIVNELNSLVATLNSMNKDINQRIGTFNEISLTNGPEFQEGEYVLDENGQRINIYEYKDYNKLIRVLAHEFGHALGIDHVSGDSSIMNAYNSSTNTNLTMEDITALKAICAVK